MKTLLATSFLALASTAAFAEPSCTPGETVKPVWESIKAFEETGGKVESFKINDGKCYEIYGVVEEKNFEIFFDPNTGLELERIAQ